MISAPEGALKAIGQQKGLDKVAEPVQKGVSGAFGAGGRTGRRVQNILNGVWLGHPLHPLLTDLPIGFWTAAVTFDALDALAGREELRPSADLSVCLGVCTAVGTAISGFADWQYTSDEPRRIGLVHAALNIGGLLLNVASLVLRRRGSRTRGRYFALAGFTVTNAAGYLGGHLISDDRIGIDHAVALPLPAEFTAALADTELAESQPRSADAGGTPVLLVRRDGRIYALADTCAHLGGPLSQGALQDGCIVCPWHGSRFALADGRTLDGPSAFPQPALEARVRDGRIEVRAK